MRILGVPSAAHREALLCETAGGGRVPTVEWRECRHGHTDAGAWSPPPGGCPHPDHPEGRLRPLRIGTGLRALILHDPADPEAGAMGLARLAWVAAGGEVACFGVGEHGHKRVTLATRTRVAGWCSPDDVPTDNAAWWSVLPLLAASVQAEHSFGLVGVHLGLLDRVEVTSG